MNRLLNYARLMRLDRPIGNWLLLWPTLWALWGASRGTPSLRLLGVFISGVWIMRAMGCVANDIIDRPFDGQVARTRTRPMVIGAVHLLEAFALLVVLGLMAFWLALQLNALAFRLSFIGLGLALTYPFMKRCLPWPQLVLGTAFGWSVPMVWVAQAGCLPLTAWLLFGAAVLWPLGYDTIYALMDKTDDAKLGLHSTALWFGAWVRIFIAVVYAAVLGLMGLVGLRLSLGPMYGGCLGVAAILMSWQLWLIREDSPQRCIRAFKNNHWVGAAIFLGFVLG